jgi:hypothetical protein
MGTFIKGNAGEAHRIRRSGGVVGVVLALAASACAATPVRPPSEPLSADQPTWPDYVVKSADRVDRICGTRETRLLASYQQGKKEQQDFKTLLGSITGAVGTVGGGVAGVGAYVIKDQNTMKEVTGATGFIGAGLGAAGTIVAILVQPGAAKVQSATQSLATLDQKKAVARDLLKKDPATWSSADKEAWDKAAKDLESTCK